MLIDIIDGERRSENWLTNTYCEPRYWTNEEIRLKYASVSPLSFIVLFVCLIFYYVYLFYKGMGHIYICFHSNISCTLSVFTHIYSPLSAFFLLSFATYVSPNTCNLLFYRYMCLCTHFSVYKCIYVCNPGQIYHR